MLTKPTSFIDFLTQFHGLDLATVISVPFFSGVFFDLLIPPLPHVLSLVSPCLPDRWDPRHRRRSCVEVLLNAAGRFEERQPGESPAQKQVGRSDPDGRTGRGRARKWAAEPVAVASWQFMALIRGGED